MDLPTVLYMFTILYMFVHVCTYRHNTVWQWCNVILFMCVVNGRLVWESSGTYVASGHIYIYIGYRPLYRTIYNT